MKHPEAAFEALARGLLGRASERAQAEMGASFDARVLDAIDLAHHHEGLVALEILVSNIHDFEVTLADDERRGLLRFADEWGLGDEHRALVDLRGRQ